MRQVDAIAIIAIVVVGYVVLTTPKSVYMTAVGLLVIFTVIALHIFSRERSR